MATTAQSVIQMVQQDYLTDSAGNRWPASRLVQVLNDMQRVIVAVRPDAGAASTTLTLLAGAAQVLPATAMALIELRHLGAAAKTAIRQCQAEDLDAVEPGWRAATQSATIVHYLYDPRHPRRFDVYPPAIVGTTLEGLVAAYPTDVGATSGDGKSYTTVSGNISLPDEFKAALQHLVAYGAYLHDAEYASNAALAKVHLDAAVAMVGEQLRAQVATMPRSQGDASA